MIEIRVATRQEWRHWLAENHDKEKNGVWLVFHHKSAGAPSLAYDEAVEEALCFGWIDSVVKHVSPNTYRRKFMPRRDSSLWSMSNKARAEKLIHEGRMTAFGLAKVQIAKRTGVWIKDPRSAVRWPIPPALSAALARDTKARRFFASLAASCQRQYAGWFAAAKRPDTRERRIEESLALLEKGKKLGLK